MKDLKGIPPQWIEEMNRLGIKPGDEFFFLVRMFNETGMSMTGALSAATQAMETLPNEIRQIGNILRGEMQAVAGTATESFKQLIYGSTDQLGALPAIQAAAHEVTVAAGDLGVKAIAIEENAVRVDRASHVVRKREWKCFWLGVLVVSFSFAVVIGAIVARHLFRLERVVATHNAPAIVRAYAETYAGHPLPDLGFGDSLESGDKFRVYEAGIGKMPAQLAYVLASALRSPDRLQASELIRLESENAKLKRQLAERAGVTAVQLNDGSVAVRVPDRAVEPFKVTGHEGFFVRADLQLGPD